jgi:predicted Na+-dependent transporter
MILPQKLKHLVFENQISIVVLAIVLGVLFPRFFQPLAAYSTVMIMAIFFASSLRLDVRELWSYAKDWKMLLIACGFMLVFIPIAMWLPLELFASEWALPFLIIGAMPTGLTIALVADLFGGKTSLALLVSVATSLLAPLTVPLVFLLTIGQTVEIPVKSLFLSLVLTIVVPFFLATFVKSRAKQFVVKHDHTWQEISVFLFGFLIAGIVGDAIVGEPAVFTWTEVAMMLIMTVYMGGLAWLAYALTAWRSMSERITIALCMIYMNNSLALYVADSYFKVDHVISRMVAILAVINILLPPLKWMAKRNLLEEKSLARKNSRKSHAH